MSVEANTQRVAYIESMAARELSALLYLSSMLGSSLEVSDIMQVGIESAVEVLRLDMGVVYLLRDEHLFLEAASPPLPPELPDEHRYARLEDHPHLARCLKDLRPVVITDALTEDLSPAERIVIESGNLRSAVFAPLHIEDRALGAFIVHTVGCVREFTDHDVDLCSALSHQISLAVANAQLYDAVRRANEELDAHRKHLEEIVEMRTRELAATNEELDSTNEELQAINEELLASNDELNAAVREAARANAELEEATKAKSMFLANMSHELRTPLNSVIGFAGILQQGLAGPLNEEQRIQIGMIAESGRLLLGLIDDVLDLSKVEAGKTELVARDFDAVALVYDVVETSRPLAIAKGLALEASASADRCMLHSDSGRIRQILVNLIGNAIKFTERGSVRVRVDCDDPETIVFAVTDTGRGISPRDLKRVFEAFTQVGDSAEAKAQGTGLGLTLSREYASLLGGELTAESEPGAGSTFTLVLPVRLPESAPE